MNGRDVQVNLILGLTLCRQSDTISKEQNM